MSNNSPVRKTHPMVLIAAVALTILSLLGSAAITGLLPIAYSEKTDMLEGDHYSGNKGNTDVSDKSQDCDSCGTIVSIRSVEKEGSGSGLGAVAGGVTGGLIGNQIGRGSGNVLMTVLGVGGGAYAGNTIEKKMKTNIAFLVKIRMADGTYRTITEYKQPDHSIGDPVKVENGRLVSNA